eukprot:3754152-Prymnesium_polylepis.1
MPLARAPPHVAFGAPVTLSGRGVDHVAPSSSLVVPQSTQAVQPWEPKMYWLCTNVTAPVTGSRTGAPPNSVRLSGSDRLSQRGCEPATVRDPAGAHGHRLLPGRAVVEAAPQVHDVRRAVGPVHSAHHKGEQRAVGSGDERRNAVIAVRQPCIELDEEVDHRDRRQHRRSSADRRRHRRSSADRRRHRHSTASEQEQACAWSDHHHPSTVSYLLPMATHTGRAAA